MLVLWSSYSNLSLLQIHAATDRGKVLLKTSPPLISPILGGGVTDSQIFFELRVVSTWFKVSRKLYRFCGPKKFFDGHVEISIASWGPTKGSKFPKNSQKTAFFAFFRQNQIFGASFPTEIGHKIDK